MIKAHIYVNCSSKLMTIFFNTYEYLIGLLQTGVQTEAGGHQCPPGKECLIFVRGCLTADRNSV